MTQKKKPFQWIETITHYAFTRPQAVLLISTLILALSLAGIAFLKVELDLYKSRNDDFPSLNRLWNMMEEFQDFSSISLLIEWPTEPNSKQVCQLVQKVRDLGATIDGTKSTFHIFKVRKIESHPEEIWFPLSLPNPCESSAASLSILKKDLDPKNPFSKFSATDKQMLIQVKLEPDFNMATVERWVNDIKSADYIVSAIGPAIFQFYIQEILKKDSLLHVLIICFFLLFFKYFFGTWRTGFYYLLTVAATLLCLGGIMGACGLPIDILTNSLFLITAIAGTADYIFICWGMSRRLTLKQSVLSYSRPGFFTTLTTSVGFISLCVSDIHTIQRFGVAAAVGALLEWFFTFMALPAFLDKIGWQTEFVTKKQDHRLIQKIYRLNHWTPPTWITIGFLIFVAFGPVLFSKMQFEENPSKNFPSQHPVKISLENFKSSLGWQNSVFVQFPIKTERSSIDNCLNQIANSPNVHSIDNPFQMEDYFTQGMDSVRKQNVSGLLSQYGALKPYVSFDSTRAIVFLKTNSPDDLAELHAIAKAQCPAVAAIVGQSDVYREVSNVLSRTLAESFLASLIIVILIVFLLQKKLGNRHYILLPVSLLGGPLFLVAGMALFDIPISPFNSMFLAILVGITGDNAIQYLFSNEDGDLDTGVDVNGPASILIGGITVISSLFFLFQTLIPMKILGILFSLGFLVNLFGDLWILKGLLRLKNYLTRISTAPKTGIAPTE